MFSADNAKYEQMLVNSLGPIELWALSTTPGDTSLRNRLYDKVGFSEGLRRLAKVFPRGSALKEIERRKADRLTRGELDTKAEAGVVDELASEMVDGTRHRHRPARRGGPLRAPDDAGGRMRRPRSRRSPLASVQSLEAETWHAHEARRSLV